MNERMTSPEIKPKRVYGYSCCEPLLKQVVLMPSDDRTWGRYEEGTAISAHPTIMAPLYGWREDAHPNVPWRIYATMGASVGALTVTIFE